MIALLKGCAETAFLANGTSRLDGSWLKTIGIDQTSFRDRFSMASSLSMTR